MELTKVTKIHLVNSIELSFYQIVKNLKLGNKLNILSVSAGSGYWDEKIVCHLKKIKKITSTDIIDSAFAAETISTIKKYCDWEFVKVEPEKKLPFGDNEYDLVYHHDVLEHVDKPYLFLSEQFRVLKNGGKLVLGTPNLFRPVNILKLFLGKLGFPYIVGSSDDIGVGIHTQEFQEYQLTILLKEIGFEVVSIKPVFFGIAPLNIAFSYFPKNKISRAFAHYLFVVCSKG
jgi:2-polyprenyl-3-methyl-5-hydroxy-6-metoxy-1,4-benzoquinol methylase